MTLYVIVHCFERNLVHIETREKPTKAGPCCDRIEKVMSHLIGQHSNLCTAKQLVKAMELQGTFAHEHLSDHDQLFGQLDGFLERTEDSKELFKQTLDIDLERGQKEDLLVNKMRVEREGKFDLFRTIENVQRHLLKPCQKIFKNFMVNFLPLENLKEFDDHQRNIVPKSDDETALSTFFQICASIEICSKLLNYNRLDYRLVQ